MTDFYQSDDFSQIDLFHQAEELNELPDYHQGGQIINFNKTKNLIKVMNFIINIVEFSVGELNQGGQFYHVNECNQGV